MDDSQIEYVRRMGTMHELMEEVLVLQKDAEPSTETVSRAREIVSTSEVLVENAHRASEMMIDGKILSAGGHIVRQHVHHYDTNLRSFNAEEYTAGVLAFLQKQGHSANQRWDQFSEHTFCMFKKVPRLNYRLGTFKLDPPPPPEKERSQRQKKAADSRKKVVSAIDQSEESPEPTDEIYKHILKCLLRCYKKNSKKPVDYLKFIIDPTDFWKTAQNIFHFSFLVRDNKVKMSQDDKGLPVVEPIFEQTNPEATNVKSKQFIFRLTPAEWRNFIDILNISEPSIH